MPKCEQVEQRIADPTGLAIGPGRGHNRLAEIAVIGDLVLAHIGIGNQLKHN